MPLNSADTVSTAEAESLAASRFVDRYNNADGGTNGATVTTGNSGGVSGTAFNIASIGTSATVTYVDSPARSGLAYRIGGQTAGSTYLGWSFAASGTKSFMRFWYRIESLSANANAAWIGYNDSTSGVLVTMLSSGIMRLRQATSTATIVSGTTVLSANTWYQMSVSIEAGVGMTLEVRDTAGALLDKLVYSGSLMSGQVTSARIGHASVPYQIFDDIEFYLSDSPRNEDKATAVESASVKLPGTFSLIPDPKVWANGDSLDAGILNKEWRDTFNFVLRRSSPAIEAYNGNVITLTSNVAIPLTTEALKRGLVEHATNDTKVYVWEAGYYLCNVQLGATLTSVTGTQFSSVLKVNGIVRATSDGIRVAGTNFGVNQQVTTWLNSGDYVEIALGGSWTGTVTSSGNTTSLPALAMWWRGFNA